MGGNCELSPHNDPVVCKYLYLDLLTQQVFSKGLNEQLHLIDEETESQIGERTSSLRSHSRKWPRHFIPLLSVS